MTKLTRRFQRKPIKALTTLAVTAVALFALMAGGVHAQEVPGVGADMNYVDLEEAIAIAFENSLKLESSRLSLREAELSLEQAEANALINPSPTELLQARRNVDIARQQLLLDRFDVKLEVEESYYGVLRAQQLTEITREALEIARRQLEIATDRYNNGEATQADVLSARSQVASSEANLAQAEGGYGLALLNFRRALGLPYDAAIAPVEIPLEVAPQEINLNEDIQFALERRIEVLQVQTGIDAAAKQVELSRNDYTPIFVLKMAENALAQAQNQLIQLKQGIELEIRQAYLNLIDAEKRIEAYATSAEEAEENLRVARRLYEVNMAPFVQIMGAQVALAQAKSDHVHAIFDYNLARARYDRAVARSLGGGDSQ